LNLVSYLNVSNPDALLADSGFVFQRLLLEELQARGHEVLLLAPAEASSLTTVPVVPVRPPLTKYHARFALDWSELDEAMRDRWIDVDMLLANQPELAAPLKASAYVGSGRDIPVATYVHYVPLLNSPREPAVVDPSLDDGGLGRWALAMLRASVESSDVCLVGSHFGRRLIEAHVGRPRRIEVIPPPTDARLRDAAATPPAGEVLRLLYNQRLYDHYGTSRLFAELDALAAEGVPFEVVVTAPTQWRSPARRTLAPDADLLLDAVGARPYVQVETALDRSDYYRVVTGVHAGLAPLRAAPLWSMAMVDVLTAGRPVFAPAEGGFAEVMDLCTGGLWDSPDDLRCLIRRAATRPPQPCAELADAAVSRWSAPAIAERFEAIVASVAGQAG